MRWARRAALLREEFRQRRLPHGLLGWRYLWPGGDQRIRRHRQLWWRSGARWPRPLWLLIQCWLWLRWVLWFGWRASWRAVRRLGPEAAKRHGLSQARQFPRVLRLALGWCIPPGDAYRFGLLQDSDRALDYVYDHELPAYHSWRSAALGLGPGQASLALLQDKLALARELSSLGLPMVQTHCCVAKTAAPDILAGHLQGLDRVFCKTRSGNQGRGAFTAWRTGSGWAGRGFEGRELPDTAAVEAAWRRLRTLDDALVQPYLTNHPDLAALIEGEDAITVRYITRRQDNGLTCLSAVLESPIGQDENTGHTGYVFLPIDAPSGRLLPWPRPEWLHGPACAALRQLWARAPEDCTLPDWTTLTMASHRAHARFPEIWAIAWDWVLTPDGPVLLEGNAGWGAAVPQLLNGGFLADEKP